MVSEDLSVVSAVGADAGELFRSSPVPEVAACADHEPWSSSALSSFVEAGGAWVVSVDGDVAGFLLAEVFDGAVHVEELSVARSYAGRGLGALLLDEASAWASSLGLPAVTLTTFSDVPWNRPMYERRGFVVVPGAEHSEAMRARVLHEEAGFGLPRSLRVVMRREVPPVVEVRDAAEADLPAITALYNALIPTTTTAWREHLASAEEISTWFAGQRAAGHPVLVAELAGSVVGYTAWTGFRYSERVPGYRHSMELTIHVDGSVHGRGVGRALISALVDRARESGVHVLVAGVDADNVGSYEFHRRLGFIEVARMPEVGRKFDRWLDLVLLQRVID
jgi:phosphinothricin acetyltransferase